MQSHIQTNSVLTYKYTLILIMKNIIISINMFFYVQLLI